ncbi:MAG: hypothetical protein WCI11_00030 [Candidatus Methylumidiphilus sp.]
MKPNPSFPDSDDPPEFTLEDMKKARLRVGLKDVSLEEWQASVRKRLNESVNLKLNGKLLKMSKLNSGSALL